MKPDTNKNHSQLDSDNGINNPRKIWSNLFERGQLRPDERTNRVQLEGPSGVNQRESLVTERSERQGFFRNRGKQASTHRSPHSQDDTDDDDNAPRGIWSRDLLARNRFRDGEKVRRGQPEATSDGNVSDRSERPGLFRNRRQDKVKQESPQGGEKYSQDDIDNDDNAPRRIWSRDFLARDRFRDGERARTDQPEATSSDNVSDRSERPGLFRNRLRKESPQTPYSQPDSDNGNNNLRRTFFLDLLGRDRFRDGEMARTGQPDKTCFSEKEPSSDNQKASLASDQSEMTKSSPEQPPKRLLQEQNQPKKDAPFKAPRSNNAEDLGLQESHKSTTRSPDSTSLSIQNPVEEKSSDALFLVIMEKSDQDLHKFLYDFFKFLHRNTDFYVVCNERHMKGFQDGDAENLLLENFRKFPFKRTPENPRDAMNNLKTDLSVEVQPSRNFSQKQNSKSLDSDAKISSTSQSDRPKLGKMKQRLSVRFNKTPRPMLEEDLQDDDLSEASCGSNVACAQKKFDQAKTSEQPSGSTTENSKPHLTDVSSRTEEQKSEPRRFPARRHSINFGANTTSSKSDQPDSRAPRRRLSIGFNNASPLFGENQRELHNQKAPSAVPEQDQSRPDLSSRPAMVRRTSLRLGATNFFTDVKESFSNDKKVEPEKNKPSQNKMRKEWTPGQSARKRSDSSRSLKVDQNEESSKPPERRTSSGGYGSAKSTKSVVESRKPSERRASSGPGFQTNTESVYESKYPERRASSGPGLPKNTISMRTNQLAEIPENSRSGRGASLVVETTRSRQSETVDKVMPLEKRNKSSRRSSKATGPLAKTTTESFDAESVATEGNAPPKSDMRARLQRNMSVRAELVTKKRPSFKKMSSTRF